MALKPKAGVSSHHYNKTLREYLSRFQRLPEIAEGTEVGVEIEVEGQNLPGAMKGWTIHQDGSLRGESAEYVFNGPANREDTRVRLDAFAARMQHRDTRVDESYRTSVHVHLNAGNMYIRHIYTQMLLYIMFEDVFAHIAGAQRIGNLFCLRAKDAEYFLERLIMAIRDDDITRLHDDQIRYSAVNPAALFRHGTLEFRSFRGTIDTTLIQQWIDLLLAIKDAANGNVFDNPIQIVQQFSLNGPDGLAAKIFTRDQINLFPQGWQNMITEGSRLIQRLAYVHDWVPTPDKVVKPPKIKYVGTGTANAGWAVDQILAQHVVAPVRRLEDALDMQLRPAPDFQEEEL